MESIEKTIQVNELPLERPLIEKLERSVSNYRRMGIDVFITEVSTQEIKAVIKQSRLINGYILNQKQLQERGKEIFSCVKNIKTHVHPSTFSLDVRGIDVDYIHDKMEEFGIKRNDLIKHLALSKTAISLFLSGKRKMNYSQRAAFFYYFLVHELNRDLREEINE